MVCPPGGHTPSHKLRVQSLFGSLVTIYFISYSPSVWIEHCARTHSFSFILSSDLSRSCESVSTRNPLPSHHIHNLKFNSLITREIFIIELLDCASYFYAYLSHTLQIFHILLYVPPMQRAGPESSAFSDYAGDRADSGLGNHSSTSCGGRALPIPSLRSSWLVRLTEVSL